MSQAACSFGEEDLLPLVLGQPASDELQAHLPGCAVCQELLLQLKSESSTWRRALAAGPTISHVSNSLPPPPPRVPACIGKYLVVGRLGEGAQGTVYRALHPDLPREVAIKSVRKRADSDSEDHGVLEREGRLLAGLDHPNIARVHDLEFHEGRPFLVIEYRRGINLQQFAAGRKLHPREAAVLLVPLGRALGYAHRRGIVHQDIKPGNLLIDDAGQLVVLDFGLARMKDAWDDEANQPSGLTVAYAAPEQARAEADKIGPASDIFSAGAVLYFLLTGNAPFVAPTFREAMKRASACDFDRAALRDRGIPRRLAAICLRAMDADPAKRYARAEDMSADLERYLRRPRQSLLLGAAACLLAAFVAIWRLWPGSAEPIHEPPGQQQVIGTLERTVDGKSRLFTPDAPTKLARLMPLRVGDKLELRCDLPNLQHAALFLVDATGEVRELTPLQLTAVGQVTRLRFPSGGVWELEGPPGTVLFLACVTRGARPLLEDVRRLLNEDVKVPTPLPVPAEDCLFLVDRDEVQAYGEESRDVVVTPHAMLRTRLERLREGLAPKTDYLWGVAAPVRK
jgi:eukaryotic-like serine/threonine-protein kinase